MRREKKIKGMWILKSLLASYVITGCLLLGLTFVVYRFQIAEEKVMAGIMIIYLVATFVGGLIIGKLTQVKKYAWGMGIGLLYFALLTAVSFGVYRDMGIYGTQFLLTGILCVGGGIFGGMVA